MGTRLEMNDSYQRNLQTTIRAQVATTVQPAESRWLQRSALILVGAVAGVLLSGALPAIPGLDLVGLLKAWF